MWKNKHEMQIKDAIRTLATEFYKSPSTFKNKSDFKERFYEICLRKKAFKRRYKLFPLTGKNLSTLRKDCPIYFAENASNGKYNRTYDIAVLSPDLITRFDFENPRHMRLLKNDVVGLIAAIEVVFITEDCEKTEREIENSYAKLDLAHNSGQKYIVAFSNSHEGNARYFRRTINDPGSPLEPSIICISVEQDKSGRKSIQYKQQPLPWITISKFKDRMERLDYYIWEKFGRKWRDHRNFRIEQRYNIVGAMKKNSVVGICGYSAVNRKSLGPHIQKRFADETGMFGDRVGLINLDMCEENSFDFREKEKGYVILYSTDTCDENKLRNVLEHLGNWHALIMSQKPVAEDIIAWIDIGGREKKPGFIAGYLSGHLFGESKWRK